MAQEAEWWKDELKFPCNIEGHFDHKVATCVEFFKMAP